MKKDIYGNLLTSFRTTQNVSDFICEIDTFMQEKNLDSVSVETAQDIKQVFATNNLDINNRDAVTDFFETLRELLKKLKTIRLILASSPTARTIENIYNYVKETIGTGYILDIEILEEVLGGAIVIYNGKYADFSLKKSLNDIFATKKDQILTAISGDRRGRAPDSAD